jgi:hypothetical protein
LFFNLLSFLSGREWASGMETVETSCEQFLKTQLSISLDLLKNIKVGRIRMVNKYSDNLVIFPSLHTIIEAALTGKIPMVEATLDFIDAYRTNDQYF